MGSREFFSVFGAIIAITVVVSFAINLNFRSTVTGDVNSDGKVNISDIAVAAEAFGTSPGHMRWKRAADQNRDNKVNMVDLILIAGNLGET
jgi:hypothetical protein